MKLSIVIISRNDLQHLIPCLESITQQTRTLSYEIIIADNDSSDGTPAYVRQHHPQIKLVQTGGNLGFGPGNNCGIRRATGEYTLLLNPDTIIHDRALEKLVAFADFHPLSAAFGCRILNSDGTLQRTAQPLPTPLGYLIRALNLRALGLLHPTFHSDLYPGWDGQTTRQIGFQAACCLLIRTDFLQSLNGFDEQFHHQYEDADLCHRIWKQGHPILYCPDTKITHIGGQNRGTYPLPVILETHRSKIRYFHKHHGAKGAQQIRAITLVELITRYAAYTLLYLGKPTPSTAARLTTYRTLIRWYTGLDPQKFIAQGTEPNLGIPPLLSTPARPPEATHATPPQ